MSAGTKRRECVGHGRGRGLQRLRKRAGKGWRGDFRGSCVIDH